MVVTLPLILILLDYWPLKRFELHKGNLILWQLQEKMPLIVLSVALSFFTLYAPGNTSGIYYKLSSRVTNAIVAFMSYLVKTFWPQNMAVFYPFSEQIPPMQITGAFLLIVFISTFIIIKIKKMPYLFVGWFWYAIAMAPVVGIIQIGNYAMADRYHYLPSIGVTVMIAWTIPALIKSDRLKKNILFPAAMIFLIVVSILTSKQCSYWRNSLTLFGRVLQVTKNNYLAHNSIGVALFTEGNNQEAIDNFSKAILIRPDFVRSYNNRGAVYAGIGQYQKAISDYNKAISLDPYSADAYNNRGIVYSKLASHEQAIVDYNEAIRWNPYYSEAYNNRGNAFFALGQYKRALIDYNEAIRIQPKSVLFYFNRAIYYFNQGANKSGCQDAQKACDLGNCNKLEEAKSKGLCD
jgi:protein O-mannosyl-transferase